MRPLTISVPLLVITLTILGCGKGGEPGAGAAPSAADLQAKIALLRDSLAAFPPPGTALPPCTPQPNVHVLGQNTVGVMLGGKGDLTPMFAEPHGDEFFWRKLLDKHADEQRRGLEGLARLGGLALFKADLKTPPGIIGTLLRPGLVQGRLVGFGLDARPHCMSPVKVEGPDAASAMVKASSSVDNSTAALQAQAETGLGAQLQRTITALARP